MANRSQFTDVVGECLRILERCILTSTREYSESHIERLNALLTIISSIDSPVGHAVAKSLQTTNPLTVECSLSHIEQLYYEVAAQKNRQEIETVYEGILLWPVFMTEYERHFREVILPCEQTIFTVVMHAAEKCNVTFLDVFPAYGGLGPCIFALVDPTSTPEQFEEVCNCLWGKTVSHNGKTVPIAQYLDKAVLPLPSDNEGVLQSGGPGFGMKLNVSTGRTDAYFTASH